MGQPPKLAVISHGEQVRMEHCDLVSDVDMDLGTVTVVRTSHHQAGHVTLDNLGSFILAFSNELQPVKHPLLRRK